MIATAGLHQTLNRLRADMPIDDSGHFASHGAFVTRAAAIAWADHER